MKQQCIQTSGWFHIRFAYNLTWNHFAIGVWKLRKWSKDQGNKTNTRAKEKNSFLVFSNMFWHELANTFAGFFQIFKI